MAVVTLNVSTALFHPQRSANYAAVQKQQCTLLCSYRDLCLFRDGPLTEQDRALGIHEASPPPSLRRAHRRSNPVLPAALDCSSRSLSSGARSRDPLTRNDDDIWPKLDASGPGRPEIVARQQHGRAVLCFAVWPQPWRQPAQAGSGEFPLGGAYIAALWGPMIFPAHHRYRGRSRPERAGCEVAVRCPTERLIKNCSESTSPS
jgi:hypothetical protein